MITGHRAADAPADLEPVDARQSDVEQHELDRVAPEFDERVLAPSHPHHPVTVAPQVGAQQLADVRLVLHHEHGRCHADIVGARPVRAKPDSLHAADLRLTAALHACAKLDGGTRNPTKERLRCHSYAGT